MSGIAPLVPADVDLRDFAYMPLDVRRLRDSDLVSDQTPEACWAALLLWCASWHQVPAGSIPDNEGWHAKQAGYAARGRIDKAWQDVRAGALYGWIACSDGRLYHPVVAEKALEAWQQRLQHAHRKECDRLRKENKARTEKALVPLEIPSFDEWNSARPVPASAGIPSERPLKGREGKGREGNVKAFPPSSSTVPATPGREPAPPPPTTTPKSVTERALDLVLLLKPRGCRIPASNPYVLEWARRGVTDAQLLTAFDRAETARHDKGDPQPVNAGYLNAIVEQFAGATPTIDYAALARL